MLSCEQNYAGSYFFSQYLFNWLIKCLKVNELHWGEMLMVWMLKGYIPYFLLRLKVACLWSDVVVSFNSSVLFQQMCSIHLHRAACYIWSNSFLHKLINVCMCIHAHKHPHSSCISTQAQRHPQSMWTCERPHMCTSKHARIIHL